MANNIFNLYPWFETRRNLIYQLFVESIISIFLIFSYNINIYNIFYLFSLHSFYVLSSYVFGRYYLKTNKTTNLIFQLLIKFTFLYTFIYFFNFSINSITFQDPLKLELSNKYLKVFTLIIFFHQFAYQVYLNKKNSKQNKWIYIGSSKNYKKALKALEIKTLNKNSNNYCKLYFYDSNKNENLKYINNIVIEKENIDIENIGFSLSTKKNYNFNSLSDWSKLLLQRYPLELFNQINKHPYKYISYPRELEQRIKRIAEFIISIFLLFLTTPILIFSVLAIFIEDGGSPFYSQERTGIDGKVFKIMKLRTMIINAENNGPKWSTKNDKRITKIGAILRKLRIDELPQLISVLIGDMSLIGPRPERPEINNQLIKEIPLYDLRHKIKPGLTGWAQVNYPYGSSIYDTKVKLSYDLYYIIHYSNTLDLLIFFKTIKLILNAKGAIPN